MSNRNPVLDAYHDMWKSVTESERAFVESIAANVLASRLNAHYSDSVEDNWERYTDECVQYMTDAQHVLSRLARLRTGAEGRTIITSEIPYEQQVTRTYQSVEGTENANAILISYRVVGSRFTGEMRKTIDSIWLKLYTEFLNSHNNDADGEWIEYTPAAVAQLEHATKVLARMVTLHEGDADNAVQ